MGGNMTHWTLAGRRDSPRRPDKTGEPGRRLLADGGRKSKEADEDDAGEETSGEDEDASNVEVKDAGEAEPSKPTWEKPDLDDIPEVEGPKTRPAESSETSDTEGNGPGRTTGERATPDSGSVGGQGGHASKSGARSGQSSDPTAGMPNTARSPGQSRLKEAGVEGYIVALELSARLPEDLRLPEEAEDLVPVAFEAELEQDIQSFAADQFDNPSPHVETLDFVEVDGDLWLRLRLGIDPESFADLDPEAIQEHALQQVDRLM